MIASTGPHTARALCYLKDCARAVALLQTSDTLTHATYNVGSGRATSDAELMAAIAEHVPGAKPTLARATTPTAQARIPTSTSAGLSATSATDPNTPPTAQSPTTSPGRERATTASDHGGGGRRHG